MPTTGNPTLLAAGPALAADAAAVPLLERLRRADRPGLRMELLAGTEDLVSICFRGPLCFLGIVESAYGFGAHGVARTPVPY
jgi:hypothetical protein